MHYIKEIFTVAPVIKIRHCIRRLMVLKEVYDPNIFTYIMATVGYSLFGSCTQCVTFKVQHFKIGNPLIQVAIVSL